MSVGGSEASSSGAHLAGPAEATRRSPQTVISSCPSLDKLTTSSQADQAGVARYPVIWRALVKRPGEHLDLWQGRECGRQRRALERGPLVARP